MSDTKRTLTEISHLFLSSVRERATGTTARPVRVPPGGQTAVRGDVSIDLTPEEFAQAFSPSTNEADPGPIAPMTAVIASHLGPRQNECVRALVRHLAAHDQRIGLIEIDAAACRLSCFEPSLDDTRDAAASSPEPVSPQQLTDVLEELNVDVDRWVLWLPNPRLLEARPLLRLVKHWTLLSTCDHDGIVAAYRAIKGLTDERHAELSLAIFDAADESEAERVFSKLASVCQQFLAWTVDEYVTVTAQSGIAEHTVLHWQSAGDRADAAIQWQVMASFLSRAEARASAAEERLLRTESSAAPAAHQAHHAVPAEMPPAPLKAPVAFPGEQRDEPVLNPRKQAATPGSRQHNATHALPATGSGHWQGGTASAPDAAPEVIELPSAEASVDAIMAAVLHHPSRRLVECPVRAPGFDAGRLAVDRERRLILLSVAGEGLGDLSAIGRAYNWLIENRSLVAMALPQLNIDAHAMPILCLLVDHADVKLDQLQPLLAGKSVRVETYRKLRWGTRTGVLLEAA